MPNWYLRSHCLVLSTFSIVDFKTMKLVPEWILYEKCEFLTLKINSSIFLVRLSNESWPVRKKVQVKIFLLSVLQSKNFKLNKNHWLTILPYFHRVSRGLKIKYHKSLWFWITSCLFNRLPLQQVNWQIKNKSGYIFRHQNIYWCSYNTFSFVFNLLSATQHGQTRSNNSSEKANELFECVWPLCGVGA